MVKFLLLTTVSGLLVLWADAGLSAQPAESSGEDDSPWYEDYYESWYRIEVVVFAHQRPPAGDEVWALAEPAYPADMVAIAPARDEDIKPHTLGQLEDLMAYEQLMADVGNHQADAVAPEEFLFEDKSRFSRDPLLAESARPGSTMDPEPDEPGIPVLLDDLFREDLPDAFRDVSRQNPQLSRIAGSLRRSTNYRLLEHLAWRQPLGESRFPVLIQGGERYDDVYELDGTITVTRSRFLHADVDLWFTEFAPVRPSRRFGRANRDVPNVDQAMLDRYPELVGWAKQRDTRAPIHTHALTQSRRMRSDTVHFIDHPFFGVVIKVTEFSYEPALPEQ